LSNKKSHAQKGSRKPRLRKTTDEYFGFTTKINKTTTTTIITIIITIIIIIINDEDDINHKLDYYVRY